MSNLTRPLAADTAVVQHVHHEAGKVTPIGDRVDGRRSLLIHNLSEKPDGTTNTVWLWVGFDQNVSASRGFPVPPGGTLEIAQRRPVWGFADADVTVYTIAELDRVDVCDLPIGSR